MVFGVHVAVGAGAGYSIELGVEALSGLSEVMILANLMSRLTWQKKESSSQASKTPRSMSGFNFIARETPGSASWTRT